MSTGYRIDRIETSSLAGAFETSWVYIVDLQSGRIGKTLVDGSPKYNEKFHQELEDRVAAGRVTWEDEEVVQHSVPKDAPAAEASPPDAPTVGFSGVDTGASVGAAPRVMGGVAVGIIVVVMILVALCGLILLAEANPVLPLIYAL